MDAFDAVLNVDYSISAPVGVFSSKSMALLECGTTEMFLRGLVSPISLPVSFEESVRTMIQFPKSSILRCPNAGQRASKTIE